MPALNEGIRKLRRAIVAQPQVDDVAQVGIITFSDRRAGGPAAVADERGAMPTLHAQASTNYGSAFRLLAQTIQQDIARLKAQGLKVYRPCAYFLTDGSRPIATWFQTFNSTLTYDKATGTGMKGHPLFIPFGFRDASEDVLDKLAYPPEKGRWFHVKTHDIEEALERHPPPDHEQRDQQRAQRRGRFSRRPPCPHQAPVRHRVRRLAVQQPVGVTAARAERSLLAIGDPGRAALELPPGPPPARIGTADVELSAASLPGLVSGPRPRAACSTGRTGPFARTPSRSAAATSPAGTSQAVAVVCDGVGSLHRSDEAAALVSRRLAELRRGRGSRGRTRSHASTRNCARSPSRRPSRHPTGPSR